MEKTLRNYRDMSHLNSAICTNDAEEVRKMVLRMEARSLNQPNTEGWIHLHEAAYAGSLNCLMVLIQGTKNNSLMQQYFCVLMEKY